MNSFRVFRRQVRRGAAALGILSAVSVLSLAPAMVASATGTITTRSIALSSSAVGATNVSYNVTFTPVSSGTNAFVVEFCADSPAVGTSCEAPAGFNVSAATTPAGNTVNPLTTPENNGIEVTLGSAATAGTPVTVPLNNVTNPSGTGALYARIVTYGNATAAQGYASATPGTYLDDGSVALSINNDVNVNGEVLESLVFCTTNTVLTNVSTPVTCSSSGLTNPSVQLGTGGALSTTSTDTGTIYTGISTNAQGGAVVNLKSNAAGCGGLINSSAPTKCYITPVTTAATTIAPGAAQFGMMLTGINNGIGTNDKVNPIGSYSATNYFLDYDTDNTNATGITSTYGSPVYNTNDAPISNGIVGMTFGANAGNETPAGNYSADLSLIATGTF